MEPRILQLLKKISAEPDRITDIISHENEYYFRYKKKLFSILQGRNRKPEFGDYSFYIYLVHENTSAADIIDATSMGSEDNIKLMAYHSGAAESAGDRELFSRLYNLLHRKDSKIDQILDDLLSD